MRLDRRLDALARWTRGDWLLVAGTVLASAGTADVAATMRNFMSFSGAGGPSLLDRAQFAAWNLQAFVLVATALGTLLMLAALLEPRGALDRVHGRAAQGLVALAALESAFCIAVFGLVVAYGTRGDLADGFFGPLTGMDRVWTIAIQALTFVPLAALFGVVAARAVRLTRSAPPELEAEVESEAEAERATPEPPTAPVAPARLSEPVAAVPRRPPRLPEERPARAEEMERLWRERLAFSPNRDEARQLLEQVRRFADLGDDESVRRLAAQLERL